MDASAARPVPAHAPTTTTLFRYHPLNAGLSLANIYQHTVTEANEFHRLLLS